MPKREIAVLVWDPVGKRGLVKWKQADDLCGQQGGGLCVVLPTGKMTIKKRWLWFANVFLPRVF